MLTVASVLTATVVSDFSLGASELYAVASVMSVVVGS